MENKINKTHYLKRFASCAVMLSLATVLSIFPSINAPLGGSITIGSMVPIMLISFLYGMKWGVPVAIGYSCIQLLLGISAVASWGLSIGVFIGCIFLDYILAYSVLCICGLFGTKSLKNVIIGTVLSCFLRYICHFLSGLLFFGSWAMEGFSPLSWAIAYNGAYMLPETIICVVVMSSLYKVIPRIKSAFLQLFD